MIELLPATTLNCGEYFRKDMMTCGTDINGYKNISYDKEFCEVIIKHNL